MCNNLTPCYLPEIVKPPDCKPLKGKPYRNLNKGSLALSSNKHSYSNGVLIHNWQLQREENPKDMILSEQCKRNYFLSTYNRLSLFDEARFDTTYNSNNTSMLNIKSKGLPNRYGYKAGQFDKKITALIDREEKIKEKFGKVNEKLPRFKDDPYRFYDLTEHVDNFRPPLPYVFSCKSQVVEKKELEKERMEKFINSSNKKCVSQFTDLDGRRRDGCHTWLDESGVYWNQENKKLHRFFGPRPPPFKERLC